MLGIAAAFRAEPRVPAGAEALGVDEEEMHLQTEPLGPLFDHPCLGVELREPSRLDAGLVADPHVEVALWALGDAAQAPQAVDPEEITGIRRLARPDRGPEQMQRRVHGLGARGEALDPGRGLARHVSRQAATVDME